MKTKAAILVKTGKPLVLTELKIPTLKPGQVLVDIAFSGVCHTQVLECRGKRGEDKYLPHCLGHEGSGVVREIGPNVTKVKPGDKVILSWMKGHGYDVSGTTYKWDGNDVSAGAITTFSRQSIISENRLTVIPKYCNLTMKEAAMLGCAVPTGLGAIFNTANPKQKQSIVIFGVGGVGLCAVAGASITGCNPIIAVDVNDGKLEIAKKMGATDCINALNSEPIQEINKICQNGVDFAIECSGKTKVMEQSLLSVRNRGGTAVIVGNVPFGEKISIDPRFFNMGKKLLGTWGGDNNPDIDFLRYADLVSNKKIDLAPLMNEVYQLDEINGAINDLEEGKAIRPLIDMNLS